MGKRFAIVIGVGAAGVSALGAQMAAAAPNVVKYDTKVTIGEHFSAPPNHQRFRGSVQSKVRKCERGRRVVLFEVRRGADRKVGAARTKPRRGEWAITVRQEPGEIPEDAWYAIVSREVHDEFVCGGDRSELHDDRPR
jgi:hypothetical protein